MLLNVSCSDSIAATEVQKIYYHRILHLLNSQMWEVPKDRSQEKLSRNPGFPISTRGFQSACGNLGLLMQPELRIFKVHFSSERCRNRGKKDKVKET